MRHGFLLPRDCMPQTKPKISSIGRQLTSTVSVSLVLLILGIVGTLGIATRSITDDIKENLGFTVVLTEKASDTHVNKLKQTFSTAPYVASYSFLSAGDILRQEEEMLGFDIMETLGVNPYLPEFDVKVKAGYANADSLTAITAGIEPLDYVAEAPVHTQMVDDINANINAVSLILLAVAVALLVISFVLINNTVRLTIYSRRFLLNTMQLVGATPGFIRRPIVMQSIVSGIAAALLAMLMLSGLFWLVNSDVRTAQELAGAVGVSHIVLIFSGMLAAGIIICGTAAFFATNKYLRQSYDDLF